MPPELDQVLDRVGLTAVAVRTEVQKVTSLDLPVADAGPEDERVVAGVRCSDLTHVAEVLENPETAARTTLAASLP